MNLTLLFALLYRVSLLGTQAVVFEPQATAYLIHQPLRGNARHSNRYAHILVGVIHYALASVVSHSILHVSVVDRYRPSP